MFTDDPLRDFFEHEAEQEEWLRKRPVCRCCGEPIQDDIAVDLGDGLVCMPCIEAYYTVNIEDC